VVSVVVTVVAALAYSEAADPDVQVDGAHPDQQHIRPNRPVDDTGTLPDPVQSLGSTAVQLGAAKILGNPNVDAVASEVTGTVDPTSGALTITATASTP